MDYVDENEVIEYHYTEEIYSPEYLELSKAIYERIDREKYSYLAVQESKRIKGDYLFLTINPNPHITLKEFVGIMTKLMSKPWITEYLYVFEQRGEDLGECGKGYHFHAIIKKPPTKSPAHIMKELASSANKVCDTSNYHFYNCKFMSEEEKERKIVYLIGKKADPSKWAKQEMDIPFRHNNLLLSHYNVGII